MLVWNTLGRTPAEIDAYCQVRADAQATEYCLWNWQNNYQDHASCFAAKRSEYKNACVRELLAQESGGSSLVPPQQPPPRTPPTQSPQQMSTTSKFALGLVGTILLTSAAFFTGIIVGDTAGGKV